MKKIVAAILIVCAFAAVFAGCEKKYSIKVDAPEYMYESCPRSAAAGETVVIKTAVVADGELHVRVNGSNIGKFTQLGVYEFVMPAEDVVIEFSVSTVGYQGS